jgi:hypothetical protein
MVTKGMDMAIPVRNGLLPGLLLALLLSTGYLVLHAVVTYTVTEGISLLFAPPTFYESLVVRRDGVVQREQQNLGLGISGQRLNLDGTEAKLLPEHWDERAPSTQFVVGRRRERGDLAEVQLPILGQPGLFRTAIQSQSTAWYLRLANPGSPLRFLEGYDTKSKQRVGFVSKRGVSNERPVPQDMWPSTTQDLYGSVGHSEDGGYLIAAPDGIWKFDPTTRTVQLSTPGVALLWFGSVTNNTPAPRGQPREPDLTLATDGANWFVLDKKTLALRRLDISAEESGQSGAVYALSDNQLLFERYNYINDSRDLVWLDAGGHVVERQQVRLAHNVHPFMALPPELFGLRDALIVPCPLVSFTMQIPNRVFHNTPSVVEETAPAVSFRLNQIDAWTLVSSLIGIVSAWLCARHARQWHVDGSLAWVLFVLIFGLPGLVGYWCHRRWPVPAVTEWLPTGVTTPPALTGAEVFA